MSDSGSAITPKEVIDEIRSSEFLLDLEGESEKMRIGAKNLQETLNRALELLSNDLYHTKSHFILELIQNADDNSYAFEATPSLVFRVKPQQLITENNEVGFTEKNVRALCSVGKSSKAANKAGYIGEKGIGFKSVFTVSDAPEIHSNGFHFKFDRSDAENLLGYVVPTWHQPSESLDSEQTRIVLPAAQGHEFSFGDFASVSAETLLFLNKLRRLEICHPHGDTIYAREDNGSITHVTSELHLPNTIAESRGTSYLRAESILEVDAENADEKRPGIVTTTVILAFPIDSEGSAKPHPGCDVFAFLPIRPEGLKFPVQADFILNSSREDILIDKPWNKALRDQISVAFVDAVETFKTIPALSLTYLTFIPSEEDLNSPFFRPIAKCIVELLSVKNCLLSASGTWKKPSQLCDASDKFRELFPSEIAIQLIGLDYIDSRVKKTSALIKKLGVKALTLDDVLNIFSKHGEWLQAQSLDWRARLYAYIASMRERLLKEKLLDYPCVPSSTGKLLVPSKAEFFFPLSKTASYGFEHELTLIDNELYEAALTYSADVSELFASFGVRSDNPYDLVQSHILPRHKGEEWMKSGHVPLIGHLRYIKEKMVEYLSIAARRGVSDAQAVKAIKDGIWVGTKHIVGGSWQFERAENLYLSSEYEPKFCIETLLGEEIEQTKLVSPSYLATTNSSSTHASEIQSWQSFFTLLGVRLSPALSSEGHDTTCSKELLSLLRSSRSEVRRATLECLDQAWGHYANSISYWVPNSRPAVQKQTKFSLSLRETTSPSRRKNPDILSKSYYPTNEILDLLGDTLTYVDATLSEPILSACAVTFKITAAALIRRLKQLKEDGGDTGKQLQNIYRALDGHLWETDSAYIRKAFHTDGLVRVKGHNKTWAKPSDVAWRSSSQFLDSIFPPLASQYKDFSRFFLERLGVFPELPTGKYVEALRHLESIENTSERRHEALSIYRKANRDLTYKPGKDAPPPPDWFEIFLNEAVFLTQADTPQAKHEHLYANDAPEIAALFAGDASVELLAVPSNEVPRLSRLLEEAGVQRLSTAVNTKIINLGDEAQDVELTERVRNSSLQLSRVLYSKYPAIFEEAVTSGQLKGLQKLEVVKVTELTMLVSLGTNTRTTMAQIAYDAGRVLYREGCLSVRDRLSAELCKFMGASPDLADTFARILSEESHNAIEEFLAVRNIATLPTDLAAEILGHEKLKSSLEDGVVDDSDALSDLEQDSGTSLQQIERKVVRVSEIKPAAVGSEHPAPPFPIEKMKGMPDEPANSPQNSIDESNSASARSADFTPAPVQSGITKTRPATNFQRQPKRIANRTYHSRLGGLRPQAANKDSLQGQANLGDTPQRHTAPTLRSGAFKITSKLNNFRRRKTQSYRASTGRLLSYAIGAETNHQTESTLADHENRVLVERAAVEYFLRTYRQEWAELHEMPVNNAGYDITAITHDGVEEWIEVKGQGSAWTEEGIALTPIELLAAAKKTDNYLLCVVEHALDDTRRKTYLIRNPYGATTQFRFDSGWKAVAARGRGKILEPREGLNIEIPGIGKGCIISAMSKGRFFTIQVKLSTGAIVQKPYNPAKMKLSEGQ